MHHSKLVIIPTFNEKENIEKIVRKVFSLAGGYHILIIDDGSPDGTAGIVKALQEAFPERLFLLERKGKQGLGTAYLTGFKWALEHGYAPPRTFYGVGGMKIFRDLVWLMRGMMRADHRFYREHGLYDFPQKRWPRMLGIGLVGAILRNRRLRRLIGDRMNEGMLAPYKKVVDEA